MKGFQVGAQNEYFVKNRMSRPVSVQQVPALERDQLIDSVLSYVLPKLAGSLPAEPNATTDNH